MACCYESWQINLGKDLFIHLRTSNRINAHKRGLEIEGKGLRI